MKPIKICTENFAAIEAELLAVNGRSNTHTYNYAFEIANLAERAEKELLALVGKKYAKGAVYVATSGSKAASAYTSKGRYRNATCVQLERRAADWFIVTIDVSILCGQAGGKHELLLTGAQDTIAVANLRKSYWLLDS